MYEIETEKAFHLNIWLSLFFRVSVQELKIVPSSVGHGVERQVGGEASVLGGLRAVSLVSHSGSQGCPSPPATPPPAPAGVAGPRVSAAGPALLPSTCAESPASEDA